MRVVDYKTGRSPGVGFEQKALFQMRFYALALWRMRGVVPRLLQLIYLGDGQVVRYEPDEADLLATERKVHALSEAIQRAHDTGEWRASPSRLCDWCAHRALCPAWGGTPPALPEGPSGSVQGDLRVVPD
jgi:putative RecB family exonuclease